MGRTKNPLFPLFSYFPLFFLPLYSSLFFSFLMFFLLPFVHSSSTPLSPLFLTFLDHGLGYGKYAATEWGNIEQKNPLFLLFSPKKYLSFNQKKKIIKNQKKLVSSYDINFTLKKIGILEFENISKKKIENFCFNQENCVSPFSKDLFEEIDENRTCKDAGMKKGIRKERKRGKPKKETRNKKGKPKKETETI